MSPHIHRTRFESLNASKIAINTAFGRYRCIFKKQNGSLHSSDDDDLVSDWLFSANETVDMNCVTFLWYNHRYYISKSLRFCVNCGIPVVKI